MSLYLLAVVYFFISAAAFNGFYDKWGFRDAFPEFSFISMADGTAHRPFVYRQLMNKAAEGAESALPQSAREWLTGALYSVKGEPKSGLKADGATNPVYAMRYHLVYYGSFALFFASLFVARAVCLSFGCGQMASAIAPAILALLIPFFQSFGGYFYDFPELLFLMLAVLLVQKRLYVWLVPLTAVAMMNKESFLFFIVALYPLLRQGLSVRAAGLTIAGLVAVAALIYLLIRQQYADNPGMTAHTHVWDAVVFYANPLNLVRREITYGLKMFGAYSLASLIAIAAVWLRGWGHLPPVVKQHVALAAAINIPLYLLLCWPGEFRNLSMLYPGFMLLLAANIDMATGAPSGNRPQRGGRPRSTQLRSISASRKAHKIV